MTDVRPRMPEPISTLDDPRVWHYRNLKDRELDRSGKWFIAEGEHVVRRLLASDFPVESVFLSEKRADQITPVVPPNVPVYVAPQRLMEQVLGFKFHSGVVACGKRKPRATIDELVPKDRELLTVVACPDLSNVENVGSMIRLCAGFGVDALVLGEHSHDPFWRQSVRVSMGTVFSLPIVHSDNLRRDLTRLRDEWGVEFAATVLDEGAESLSRASRGPRFGLLFGNEAQGLDDAHVAVCQRRVTIPMKLGTDSLNVAVAAGIFLYHFTRETSDRT
jgi:tRNA G18 (ribose-2'-O)-methylase SpoU